MKYWVGVTDGNWFSFLAERKPDEVNFWRPSAKSSFQPIPPGAPFLFKLHSPDDFIVGGGFFVKYSVLPLSLAWLAFGEKNGTQNEDVCRKRILQYRREQRLDDPDPEIGCIILTQPFFLERSSWIPAPKDWAKSIVVGKTYDTEDSEIGFGLWEEVKKRANISENIGISNTDTVDTKPAQYGDPYLSRARLGQGAFRVLVTDTYERKCAITGEKTLPVLEAAHIKAFSEKGPNNVQNGLLLRSDFHTLFDRYLVTVDPKLRILVSPKIKEKFQNGKEYYAYHGKELRVIPQNHYQRPDPEYLKWHNERFLA